MKTNYGLASVVECQPLNLGSYGVISGQHTCPGCRPGGGCAGSS